MEIYRKADTTYVDDENNILNYTNFNCQLQDTFEAVGPRHYFNRATCLDGPEPLPDMEK